MNDTVKDYPPFIVWDPCKCFRAVKSIVDFVNVTLTAKLDPTKPLREYRENGSDGAGNYLTEYGRQVQAEGQALYDERMNAGWSEMAQTDIERANWIFGKRSKLQ